MTHGPHLSLLEFCVGAGGLTGGLHQAGFSTVWAGEMDLPPKYGVPGVPLELGAAVGKALALAIRSIRVRRAA